MENIPERVELLTGLIQQSCMVVGLNLTVYEGKIAFVDQAEKKIVAVWNPEYTAADIPGGN